MNWGINFSGINLRLNTAFFTTLYTLDLGKCHTKQFYQFGNKFDLLKLDDHLSTIKKLKLWAQRNY